MTARTYTATEILAALQVGAPETIGYGPLTEAAFRHGWQTAMDRVYAQLGIERAINEMQDLGGPTQPPQNKDG